MIWNLLGHILVTSFRGLLIYQVIKINCLAWLDWIYAYFNQYKSMEEYLAGTLLVMYEVLLLGYLPGIVTSKNMEV